jgi:hypothetical protein
MAGSRELLVAHDPATAARWARNACPPLSVAKPNRMVCCRPSPVIFVRPAKVRFGLGPEILVGAPGSREIDGVEHNLAVWLLFVQGFEQLAKRDLKLSERPLFPDRGFAALLFDLDGTILCSIAAAERIWTDWARRHGLDVAAFLPTIHGVRSVDTVRRLALPGLDPETEADAITRAEMEDLDGIDGAAGAADFLASLPSSRWAVVTSAPRRLSERRLEAAGLPVPPLMTPPRTSPTASSRPTATCLRSNGSATVPPSA